MPERDVYTIVDAEERGVNSNDEANVSSRGRAKAGRRVNDDTEMGEFVIDGGIAFDDSTSSWPASRTSSSEKCTSNIGNGPDSGLDAVPSASGDVAMLGNNEENTDAILSAPGLSGLSSCCSLCV